MVLDQKSFRNALKDYVFGSFTLTWKIDIDK